jgi:hypothetical protein
VDLATDVVVERFFFPVSVPFFPLLNDGGSG